jgi:hypothetical protein
LHGGEEPGIEFRFLIRDQLADALADADPAVFQFDHGDGDAVEVEDKTRTAFRPSLERHLLGDGEVIFSALPIDQMHGLRVRVRRYLDLRPVAEHLIDRLVGSVKVSAFDVGLALELVDCRADRGRGISPAEQIGPEEFLIDIAVAGEVRPVAEVGVTKPIPEQGDDPVLRRAFWFADFTHG